MLTSLRDILFAIILLLIVFPLLIFVYISCFIDLKENPIFIQDRIGYKGEIFKLVKFKTMRTAFNNSGILLNDERRVSKFGKLIRSLSIDELPQLINIIKGDMSFVGPRPLLLEYLPLYSEYQNRRHNVKPGITGWAQVNGRNAINWEEKFKLDVWYVDNQSFYLDCKIIWMTILKVIKRDGISSNTSVTMEKFKGNNI